MKQYQLAMPQQVYSGETAIQALQTLASGHEKAVVFTDAGIRASGILERPLAELEAEHDAFLKELFKKAKPL